MTTLSELCAMPSRKQAATRDEEVDYRDEYLQFVRKIRQHLEQGRPLEESHPIAQRLPLSSRRAERTERD